MKYMLFSETYVIFIAEKDIFKKVKNCITFNAT